MMPMEPIRITPLCSTEELRTKVLEHPQEEYTLIITTTHRISFPPEALKGCSMWRVPPMR